MKQVSNDLLSQVIHHLAKIMDPELPFISIKDLGILRQVKFINDKLQVMITPTFSGCPAMNQIETEIKQVLLDQGIKSFEIKKQLSPPWSSSDLTSWGKKQLLHHGIAVEDNGLSCPKCKSDNIRIISAFGATSCKSFAKCNQCLEPFEFFKSID